MGIDDLISSIWIGGLILSLSFITASWIEKSKWREKIYKHLCKFKCGLTEHQSLHVLIVGSMYALGLTPLFLNRTIGIKGNTFWGIDKIILGIAVGSLVFLLGIWADKKVRKSREGKQLFIFQKVAFPVLSLLATSVIFWFLLK